MSAPNTTPGPWRWEVNLKHRDVKLCGGRPPYDSTVLDAVRWGMSGGGIRLQVDGRMMRLDELTVAKSGREHHADWFQLVKHPDAQLIEAAPDLYAALAKALDESGCDGELCMHEWHDAARAALKRARGE